VEPSLNIDSQGNLLIGYKASSTTIDPGIRYAGHLASDPANDLAQGESVLIVGTGHQTSTTGLSDDYSATFVDPSDGCTFWHTNEYYSVTSNASWNTRIGTFKFDNCIPAATGTLQGIVTDSATTADISGSLIQISNGSTLVSSSGGVYSRALAPGAYSVTFSKSGYNSQTINGIVITNANRTTLNVALTAVGKRSPQLEKLVQFDLAPPVCGASAVRVVATAGTLGPTDYSTLKASFDAINAGTHRGDVGIYLCGNTAETASAVLNASSTCGRGMSANCRTRSGALSTEAGPMRSV